MHFDIWTTGITTVPVECLVVGAFEEGELTHEARTLDAASGGRIAALLARGDLSGKLGETLLVTDLTGTKATRALVTGLGRKRISLARRGGVPQARRLRRWHERAS